MKVYEVLEGNNFARVEVEVSRLLSRLTTLYFFFNNRSFKHDAYCIILLKDPKLKGIQGFKRVYSILFHRIVSPCCFVGMLSLPHS